MIIVGVCDVVPSICVIKNSVLANFKVQQAMGHLGQNPFSYLSSLANFHLDPLKRLLKC